MDKKPVVVYCDDKQYWINEFRKHHSQRFDIEDTTNGKEFLGILERMKRNGISPDIILIDLFHPKYNNQDEQKKWDKPGNEAIERLENAIKEAKGPIYDAWEPLGLELLEHARKWHPDTPIAIYTQQGISVVDDNGLVKVSNLRGEWLLKGRQPTYEMSRLLNMMDKSNIEKEKIAAKIKTEVTAKIAKHYISLTKGVMWFLAIVIFVAPLIYSLVSGQNIINILSLSATIASLLITIMSFFIPFIDRLTQKSGSSSNN